MTELLPLSNYGLVSTSRDDEAADILSGALLPCRVARISDRKDFHLQMNGQSLRQSSVLYNQYAVDTQVEIGRVQDMILIAIGHDDKNPSHFEIDNRRVRASPTCAAIMSPTRRIHIDRGGRSGLLGATVPAAVLKERIQDMTGERLAGPLVFDPSVDLINGPGRLFRETILAIQWELESTAGGIKNKLRLALLEDALLSAILNIPGSHMGEMGRTGILPSAPWMVRRTEDYMAANLDRPITLSELAKLCGCSRSSLTQAFRLSRDYTPMQFLLARRLEAARRQLINDPDATSTEIALSCGFGNHGRFAKAYQGQFGELPSVTRSR